MSSRKRILVIDDEPNIGWMIQESLRPEYEVAASRSGEEGLALFRGSAFDAVILDRKLAGVDGIEVLSEIKRIDQEMPVIIITAYASVETAVSALKIGAFDYIVKPLILDRLKIVIGNALQMHSLKKENKELKSRIHANGSSEILGISSAVSALKAKIEKIANVDTPVLIQGESGVGKELVAKEVHRRSGRAGFPFVPINCAAIPDGLMESELFGHEKGAFTGAYQNKKGKFEIADKGSIFFDEIGEMSMPLQAKLLRVIEEKMIDRVGGSNRVETTSRIICATNKDLEESIKAGSFRQDLYYRISVLPVRVAPLRERTEDIPFLARHFLSAYSQKYGKRWEGVSLEADGILCAYDWPGNVRELKNTIEQICILYDDERLQASHLPPRMRGTRSGTDLRSVRREAERQAILLALQETEGNKAETARRLRISTRLLYMKFKEYGIS